MEAGVPVVPGTPGPVATYSDGDAFIKEYGFPGQSWVIKYEHYDQFLTPRIKLLLKPPWGVVGVACVL